MLKASFRLSSGTEELAVAAVLIGAVIGGLIGGRLADKFSRRRTGRLRRVAAQEAGPLSVRRAAPIRGRVRRSSAARTAW